MVNNLQKIILYGEKDKKTGDVINGLKIIIYYQRVVKSFSAMLEKLF